MAEQDPLLVDHLLNGVNGGGSSISTSQSADWLPCLLPSSSACGHRTYRCGTSCFGWTGCKYLLCSWGYAADLILQWEPPCHIIYNISRHCADLGRHPIFVDLRQRTRSSHSWPAGLVRLHNIRSQDCDTSYCISFLGRISQGF